MINACLVRQIRQLSRKARFLEGVPQNVGSRASKIEVLQRRFLDHNLEDHVEQPKAEYETESMAAELHIMRNRARYEKVIIRRKVTSASDMLEENSVRHFPFAVSVNPMSPSKEAVDDLHENKVAESHASGVSDRGYFVDVSKYCDEYIAGTALELPDDEMNVPTTLRFGPDDAVENIEFQLPHQNAHDGGGVTSDEGEEQLASLYATVDPSIPTSKKTCTGCGANFHCKDTALPGFLPLEVFIRVEEKRFHSNQLCKRCHLLKYHNFLMNVNVCNVDYVTMMSRLRSLSEVLVLLVVDATDIPGSIHKELPRLIGARKPMIVAVNKVDLLPPDAQCGYLKRIKFCVEKQLSDAGFDQSFNIMHTGFVSAKTGYGIEDLITQIHLKWTNVRLDVRNDIYLVGCTNSGKSTMFNILLRSDLCKVQAIDTVERATTSPWPGTTISLLKFPIMHPTPHRLELRRRRLLTNRAWAKKEDYVRKQALQGTGNSSFAILQGDVGNTFKSRVEEMQPISVQQLLGEEGDEPRKLVWNPKELEFAKGAWCYDTPGTVNNEQLLADLTLEEIIRAIPRRILLPRSALVKPGQTLLVGGVGRVDVLGAPAGGVSETGILLTTFASDGLPLHVVLTDEVDEFLKKYLGTDALGVPLGGPDRLSVFPQMMSEEFTIKPESRENRGWADIVMSSFAWSLVTCSSDVVLRVFTPAGRGIACRVPPILPFAASLRGSRISGTQFYKVKPLQFPVNLRRLRAQRRRYQNN